MFTFLKYLSWFLTNILAISGTWLVKFTKDGPDGKLVLTKWGRVGLPLTGLSFVLAFVLTVNSDLEEASTKRNLDNKLDNLTKLVVELGKPKPDSQTINNLAQEPSIRQIAKDNPDFNQSIEELIASRIGGKSGVITRLKLNNPSLDISEKSIAVLATFGLQHYGMNTDFETHNFIVETIRGIEADVIALQEVAEVTAVNLILESLPEFDSVISSSGRVMKQALLYRRNRVSVSEALEIPGPFARQPISLQVNIGQSTFNVIGVHLRRGTGSQKADEKRTREVEALANWIRSNKPNDSIVIMGLFQTEITGPELKPLYDLNAVFATKDLPNNVSTYIDERFRGQLSHFALLGSIQNQYISKSAYVYELPKLIPEMSTRQIEEEISDHNPVGIVINLGN